MINDSHFINLNSKDATKNNSTFNSDVFFPFKSILQDDPTIIYSQINVYTCSIPISFYIINEYNNKLGFYGIIYNDILTIPVGNYTVTSLISTIKNLFTALGAGIVFNITLDKNTGILTFVRTSFDDIGFFLSANSILPVLGFTEDTEITSLTLTGNRPANLLGIKKLKIFSSALATSSFSSANYGTRSLLKTLCVNDSAFGVILFQTSGEFNPTLIVKNITGIDLQIRDEEDNLVNFNNIDWNITLQINSFRLIPTPDTTSFQQLASQPISPVDNSSDPVATDMPLETGDNSLDLLLYNQKLREEGITPSLG